MRYTYLVIDTGKSAYVVKSEAEKQAQFLNKIVYRDMEVKA